MALDKFSVTDLEKEIARRQKQGSKLLAKRDRLARQLATLDAQLAELGLSPGGARPGRGRGRGAGRAAGKGGASRRGGRGRARNAVSLPDAIAQAMEVRAVVSPKEAAALVLENGYKTTSKTFNIQVSQALAKDPRFKRVGRGQYERVK